MRHEVEIMGHRLVFCTWTYGEKQEVLRRIMKRVRNHVTGQEEIEIDPFDLNDQMLLKTLVSWDLVDDEGKPLSITLESIRAISPPELVEQMIAFTQRLNGISEEDRKKS